MAKKIVQHLHTQTPHKDRLILVALVATLAFSIINTVMISTEVVLAATNV